MAAGSWAELEGALSADEMSLWKLERLRELFLCTSVQVWVHGGAGAVCPELPMRCKALGSALPATCPFQPLHFIAARQQSCSLLFHLFSPSLSFLSREGAQLGTLFPAISYI